MTHPLIDMRNVRVSYRNRPALGPLSWRLAQGEHWAVLGANGAGKSTFLRLVRGEIWPDQSFGPTAGSRMYCAPGEESPCISPLGFRERIGLVSAELQEKYPRYGWDMNGLEVTVSGYFDSLRLYRNPDDRQCESARNLLNDLGMQELADRSILAMSQGQARRVLIARALVNNPALLVLDEVMEGLDAESRMRVSGLIDSAAANGVQILFASHRKEELPDAITHCLVLRNGLPAACGPRDCDDVRQALAEVFPEPEVPASACPPVGASDPEDSGTTGTCPSSDGAGRAVLFDVRDARVFLDRREVLKVAGWSMRQGENWGIIGANGAGKTTFLNLLLGLIHPALGGRVLRLGLPEPVEQAELKRRIGHVGAGVQAALSGVYETGLEAGHFSEMTGEDLVCSGLHGTLGLFRSPTPEEREKAADVLRKAALSMIAERSVRELSYGQLRRLLLARALVHRPEVLVMDEPCAGLDTASRHAFLHTLRNLASQGTSLLQCTHHPDELIPEITHILHISSGRITYAGPRAEAS